EVNGIDSISDLASSCNQQTRANSSWCPEYSCLCCVSWVVVFTSLRVPD
ncbi:11091_t:CDS:2, partial [Diversispora eburnea]